MSAQRTSLFAGIDLAVNTTTLALQLAFFTVSYAGSD